MGLPSNSVHASIESHPLAVSVLHDEDVAALWGVFGLVRHCGMMQVVGGLR